MMKSMLALLLYLPAIVFAQTALDSWYGEWIARYSGDDSGTCSVTIGFSSITQAALSAICISDSDQRTIFGSGQLTLNGGVALTAGTSSDGAQFTGTLHGTSGSGQWTNAQFGASGTWTIVKLPAPFALAISGLIAAARATVMTRITFNPPDVGRPGAVFVKARVPASGLGTLGLSTALNNVLSTTGTGGDPDIAESPDSLDAARRTMASPDPNAFVLVQLTSSGWQQVVNGQLIPYASGVLGDQLAAQTILNNTDTTNLKGAQFCLGYGTSAAEMIAAGRLQQVASIPDPNSTAAPSGTCVVTAMPVYRFFNNNAGGHFYTINEPEKNTVIQNYNWFRYEGTGFYASTAAQSGMLPVYRFFNNNAGGHFYTINEAEKNTVIQNYSWFRYEGPGFYASQVAQSGMLPVYRFFNNNAGGHFYTMNEAEKNTVIQNYSWFRYEGIGFYAYPSP